jgi:hypothetical protein
MPDALDNKIPGRPTCTPHFAFNTVATPTLCTGLSHSTCPHPAPFPSTSGSSGRMWDRPTCYRMRRHLPANAHTSRSPRAPWQYTPPGLALDVVHHRHHRPAQRNPRIYVQHQHQLLHTTNIVLWAERACTYYTLGTQCCKRVGALPITFDTTSLPLPRRFRISRTRVEVFASADDW